MQLELTKLLEFGVPYWWILKTPIPFQRFLNNESYLSLRHKFMWAAYRHHISRVMLLIWSLLRVNGWIGDSYDVSCWNIEQLLLWEGHRRVRTECHVGLNRYPVPKTRILSNRRPEPIWITHEWVVVSWFPQFWEFAPRALPNPVALV